ncbi:MAG: OmpH family outer membrane protein [Elusimicrobia bacterium]|nr:OmpH family outer membrane protein [Elusimicrobiota bacterium]
MKSTSASAASSRRLRLPAWILLACGAASGAWGVEVSLEENRAQRGSIGYVDMQAVFRAYPETQKAKENFEQVVRQAEEQVHLRKSELTSLRADISQLRIQRELLARSPIQPAPAEPDPPLLPEETAPPVQVSTSVQISSPTAADGAPAAVDSTTTSVSTSTAAVASAEGAPQRAPAALIAAHLPGLAPESSKSRKKRSPAAAPGPNPALIEADQRIAEKIKLLQDKEFEFKAYQSQVEKNLIELENRRTEILLGKIYEVVQTVAREEGVGVVVDKSQILFGHKAVDLTAKVVEKLRKP